jgi:hypothetical protein
MKKYIYKYIVIFISILGLSIIIYSFLNKLYSKTVLICISSKSPNPMLYKCIDILYKIQIQGSLKYKICVVDSDSDDLSIYNKINKDFPNVEIHFIKNKNYEYGAWKYAQTIYPDYELYFCIQDSIIINKKINLNAVNDKNVYTYHDHSGYHSHLEIKEKGIDNIKDTGLEYAQLIDTKFNLAQHSIFIVNNRVMKDIFKTLNKPPVDKDGSCFYERNFGLYFIIKHINTINLKKYVTKYNGKRK